MMKPVSLRKKSVSLVRWYIFEKYEKRYTEKQSGRNGKCIRGVVVSQEYRFEWKSLDESYYPVNDERKSTLYTSIRTLLIPIRTLFSALF